MSSRKFSFPSRAFVRDWLPEGHGERLWQRIETARRRREIPIRKAWVLTVVSAVVAALFVYWLASPSSAGNLRLADGREVPGAIDLPLGTRLALSDGSRMEGIPGAHLDVLESTHHAFGVALRRGGALFDVRPGGPRTWRIECGAVTVEVVGTRFTVDRNEAAVRVAVERGAVLVRGDPVPDRVVRLGAGQSITVQIAPLPVTTGVAISGPKIAPSISSAGLAPGTTSESQGSGTGALQTTAAGQDSAPAAKPSGPPPVTSAMPAVASSTGASTAAFAPTEATATPPTVETLLAAADAAREKGRFTEAANLLERVLAEHGNDSHAALTEFSLGRLYLESLSNAPQAASHFARAIARRLPTGLDEDARARLVEALSRSGNVAAAQDAATTYRALYPNGRRSRDIDRWLSAPR